MAFDFVIGTAYRVKDRPSIVGSIEFDELPQLERLGQRIDSFFLQRIANLFADQQFSVAEVAQALDHLLPLLSQTMPDAERAMLHKLIAVLAFAQSRQQTLFGVAD
ncbi:hypothetical protein [Comamonas guangdongensis]|uniref:Uncharacterized protein n=1 Tax=Comamonas guangdongensis TaxID=510515 RepID=A0ABV3ZSY8_9BURK